MIQTNRKRGPRMDYVLNLLFSENISIRTLAAKMGLSPQAVNEWFRKDDCKLSRMEQMAEACGYEFHWEIREKKR